MIGPLVAPPGTVVVICVPAPLTVKEAAVPLKLTRVVPAKLLPSICTWVPLPPDVGLIEVITGAGMTVKEVLLVPVPPSAVMLMVPLVAPTGMVAVHWVVEELEKLAALPANCTAVTPTKLAP